MRFLFVQPELSYRGAERVVATLTNSLVDKKHTVRSIFLKRDPTLTDNFIDEKVDITVPPLWINKLFQNNILFTLFSPLYALYTTFKYTKQADIIISDSFPCLWSTILIAKLKNKKVYWMLHSFETTPPPQANLIQKAYFWSILSVNKHLIKYMHAALTNSPKVTLNLQSLFPQLNVQEITPPVTIPPNITAKIPPNLKDNNRKKIISVGHIHPLKNQQLAIDAYMKVREEIPNTSLIFIGDGDPLSLNKYNLTSLDVIFTGKLKYDELANYYKIANIVLQTSFYPEGLGLTPFEGLLYKKIPVVVEGSGAAFIIKKEKIGIVVKNDPEELARAIIEAISHPEKYEYTILKGWEYVTSFLTPEHYVSTFLKIVTTL